MILSELLAAMGELALANDKPRALTIKGLGTVHIREITIGEIDAQLADTSNKDDHLRMARGATRLLCDENGKRLLDPDDEDHVELMAKMPLRVLTAINGAQEEASGN